MYSAPGVMEHVGQPATLSDCPTHLSSHHAHHHHHHQGGDEGGGVGDGGDGGEDCDDDDHGDIDDDNIFRYHGNDDQGLISRHFLQNFRRGSRMILLSSQENQRTIPKFPTQTDRQTQT